MGNEGPCARPAESCRPRAGCEVGLHGRAACRGGALVPSPPYDIAIRFVLTSCAMGVMFQAFQARRYALAVMFGALGLLYNPVVPELSFQAANSAR